MKSRCASVSVRRRSAGVAGSRVRGFATEAASGGVRFPRLVRTPDYRTREPPSMPKEVTRIATRILPQVILVVRLGAVPRRGGFDRRRDRSAPLARRVDAGDHLACGGFLLG